MDLLRVENRMLRDAVENMINDDITKTMKAPVKRMSTRDPSFFMKWKYYHENKAAVVQDLSAELGVPTTNISWALIKKETDQRWAMSLR